MQLWFYFIIDLVLINVHLIYAARQFGNDADDDSVTRSLEAYLLWLFGYIMFNNSHGAYVDRVLVPYAQEIAEAAVEEMPQYSWGSAVLAATYRGLCKASVQNKHNAILLAMTATRTILLAIMLLCLTLFVFLIDIYY